MSRCARWLLSGSLDGTALTNAQTAIQDWISSASDSNFAKAVKSLGSDAALAKALSAASCG